MQRGDPPNGHPMAPLPLSGKIADRYKLTERLGAGGMGEVYKAWDTLLHRWVAIKRLKPRSSSDRRQWERILREARAASPLNHPAIVAIYDALEYEGEAFLVQELAQGTPLRKKLDRSFDLGSFYTFAQDCASALAAASAMGIVHCDLKPENILLTKEGRARILDFGIAQHFVSPAASRPEGYSSQVAEEADPATVTTTITSPGAGIWGTPTYLSPELIAGIQPDARADIFSLGVVFYEMLSGRHPFLRRTMAATLVAIDRDTPSPPSSENPRVPPELDALVLRMLEKDRERRPPTPDDLLAEIRALRLKAGVPYRPGLRLRVRVPILILGAAAVLVAGFFAIREFTGPHHPRKTGDFPINLAVERFSNLSTDPANELFARGMVEAVQSRLAGLEGIQIVDADSVGAKYSLAGTVQRSRDRLRITYRIIECRSGHTIAGSIVESDVQDLFGLQDQVTDEIARALRDEFHLAPLPEPGPRPTLDVTAYDYYLQARGYLHRAGDQSDIEIASELFQKALAQDPEFTLALAGLGEAYWKLHLETKDPEWAAKAEEVSLRALAQAHELAEVHVTLGTVYQGTDRPVLASDEFRRALEIDPRSNAAYLGLARAQEAEGDLEAAEGTFHRAIRTRPADWESHSQLGMFYYRQGRLEETLASFLNVVELTPDNARAFSDLGAIYQLLGRFGQAVKACERSIELKPNYRAYSNLATAYRSDGRLEEAARTYTKALSLDDRDYRVWGSLGATYSLIPGRSAEADSAFRRAIVAAQAQLEVNPSNALLLAVLAQYYVEVDQTDAARRLVRRAQEIAPDRPDVLFYVSGAYEILGDRAQALDAVRRAIVAGYPAQAWRREPSMDDLVADPEFDRIVREAQDGTVEGR